jgi:hypothetical protein
VFTQLKNAQHTASTKQNQKFVVVEENHGKKERVMRVQVHVDLHYGLEERLLSDQTTYCFKKVNKKKED